MRDRLDEIRAAGAGLALVGNGSLRQAAHFHGEWSPDCEVYTDPGLETYRALGMRRSVGASLGRASVVAGLRAFLGGHRQGALGGDPWQQGGLYVLAPGGRIIYSQPHRGPADRPDLDAALAALTAARTPGPGPS